MADNVISSIWLTLKIIFNYAMDSLTFLEHSVAKVTVNAEMFYGKTLTN